MEPPLLRHLSSTHEHATGPPKMSPNLKQLSAPGTPELDRGADPLSAHILARAQTGLDAPAESPSFRRNLSDLVTGKLEKIKENVPEQIRSIDLDKKDKKKRVSFFAKLRGKDTERDGHIESPDELHRSEGAHARTFSACHLSEQPTYIRVRSSHKPDRDFNNLFLAQELCAGDSNPESAEPELESSERAGSAIWSMKFSVDGKYLATGGHDMVVRIWKVLSAPKDRQRTSVDDSTTLNAPVFCTKPYREYRGHTADVLDLSWSKNNFLLSSSMDKTVRLWHVSRDECLCCFQHTDFVTSIAFHPRDDRYFLSGSLDCKLRLWNIPGKVVSAWNELPELITAVEFDPVGRVAIVGTFTGLCLFYETDGLRYHTQMHVKSSRGRNSHGSKITGIQATQLYSDNPHSDIKLLISSNDSRIRIYNLRDKDLEAKFKGNVNTSSQIRGSFSDGLRYVICGSEDHRVYVWNARAAVHERKDRRACEYFEAHTSIVSATVFAPQKTCDLLAASGDPIFDMFSRFSLHSAAESIRSQQDSDYQDDRSNSKFPEGNIIISADYNGIIKVFRQDCAAELRTRTDDKSETSSILSKRVFRRASIKSASIEGRRSSNANSTTSQDSSSIIRKPHEATIPVSPARSSTMSQNRSTSNLHASGPPKIHLNGESTNARDVRHLRTPRNTGEGVEARDRNSNKTFAGSNSHGPNQGQNSSHHHQHHHQQQQEHRHSHHSDSRSKSPTSSRTTAVDSPDSASRKQHRHLQNSFNDEANPYLGQGGISYGFYDTDGLTNEQPHTQRPSNDRTDSIASMNNLARHSTVSCLRCGSVSFSASRISGEMCLTCQSCGSVLT